MDVRLVEMRERVRAREQAQMRRADVPEAAAAIKGASRLSWPRRIARQMRALCEAETPVIGADERIVFTRTVPQPSHVPSGEELLALSSGQRLHEAGPINNICADWGMAIGQGLLARRAEAVSSAERLAGDPDAAEYMLATVVTIDAVLDLVSRYAQAARDAGRHDLAARLARVPAHGAQTFHEALQSLRFLQAMLWLSGHYHVGLGRFDQYMWPYLKGDLDAGRETVESAEALLAEFYISLNRDSDLYPGVQQGDNGQTLTLGGVRPDGQDGVNELTWMALRVGLETSMIDPKINLRICPDTDLALLDLAAEMTRKGLGFPQYSNDDVVIPALVAHGYKLEDARDYTVAACWEFIIPGKGMEVVNIGAVSFPYAVDAGLRVAAETDGSMDALLVGVRANIEEQVAALADSYARLLLPPAPYYSALMTGCLESGRDLSLGNTYNNYGVHGAASADAADALATVEQCVCEQQAVSLSDLVDALDADYDGHEALRQILAKGPHVGDDDDRADRWLAWLYDAFADACEALADNGRGGILRPGTGSAMYYIWLAEGHEGMMEPVVGATANGRHKGTYFSANLSPSQSVRARGPLSMLRSYSKIDYGRICNGGPITLELSDAVFRDEESVHKVALLVRLFAQLGCQQLQLNTVNVDTLFDAQAHPERHTNLIVRVWGWSAYFVELAPEYQQHVINRQLHVMA